MRTVSDMKLPGGATLSIMLNDGVPGDLSVVRVQIVTEGRMIFAAEPGEPEGQFDAIGAEQAINPDDPRGLLGTYAFLDGLGKLLLDLSGRVFKAASTAPSSQTSEGGKGAERGLFGGRPEPEPGPRPTMGEERGMVAPRPALPPRPPKPDAGDYRFVNQSNCRSCEASILWFDTPKGKRFPVDDLPGISPGRLLEPGDRVPGAVAREFSHFGTCPDAAKFSGGGRR